MQTVDLIIENIDWLITVDPGRRIIRDGAVAIDGGKFVAVGKSADIEKAYAGARKISGRNTVATPGFIDCHLHSSFQLSRGLADEPAQSTESDPHGRFAIPVRPVRLLFLRLRLKGIPPQIARIPRVARQPRVSGCPWV